MNDTSFMQHLEQPQVFNFEIVFDRVRIIKGDQRNYIPPDESHKSTKPYAIILTIWKKKKESISIPILHHSSQDDEEPSFHGSIKKKKKKKRKRKKSRKRSSKKRKKKRKSKRGSSKSSSKTGSKGSSKKSSPSGSKKGSKSGSKKSSKRGSPKKSKSRRKKSKKDKKKKKKKSKGGKKGKGKKRSKSPKKKRSNQPETLPGNRKEIPPLRLGIDALGFHDIYVNQIDVDLLEEEEFISAGDSPYTPTAGTGSGTTSSSEHGPVNPEKLAKALEDAKQGKVKKKGKKSKSSSKGSKKKSRSKSRSKSSSGSSKRKSQKDSKGGSKMASKTGSKKGSKRGSKKGSKRGSKKGSKRRSKKGSPKGKKRKSKSPKRKKKSGKATPKKKPADTPSTIATEAADTWSVASETAIKRGRAIMLSEIPRKMITHFQGNPIKIRVERYGGKRHNNGEVIPVGTVTVPFPPDWSEAVLEVQREINPSTYDASAFPIERGIVGRYSIKDATNEYIGDIKLEMNLYCFANTAVSKVFPTDASLYDALLESENIPKCCDAMTNKRRGRRSNYKADKYHGYSPGDPNPYEYAWEYARRQKEINKEKPAIDKRHLYGDYSSGIINGRMIGEDRGTAGDTGDYYENVRQMGECYDVYPKAKTMNYTEKFNL